MLPNLRRQGNQPLGVAHLGEEVGGEKRHVGGKAVLEGTDTGNVAQADAELGLQVGCRVDGQLSHVVLKKVQRPPNNLGGVGLWHF